MVNCSEITQESDRLKGLFGKCYNLKAKDLRDIVELVQSVNSCANGSFQLKTINGQSLFGTGDIVLGSANVDGSETKVLAGAGVTITGSGRTSDPYVFSVSNIPVVDGSETKIIAGANTSIAGSGTDSSPYVVNAIIPAQAEQVNSDWSATSGKAQILNKPNIPAAQINSDWNATSGPAMILNKPATANTNIGYQPNQYGGKITSSNGTSADIPLVSDDFPGLVSKNMLQANSQDIDNINKEITIELPSVKTNAGFVDKINSLPSFTIGAVDLIKFKAVDTAASTPTKYYVEIIGRGKGNYGLTGYQLTPDEIRITNFPLLLSSISEEPTTQFIDLGVKTGNVLTSLNSKNPPVAIQSQDRGYSIIKGTFGGYYEEYLWVGNGGIYGQGALQALVTDLKKLSNGEDDLATPANSGTVKVDVLVSDPVVYIKQTIDQLLLNKENLLPSGTELQYIRGDKTLATFPTGFTVDQTIINGSTNGVSGNAVHDALATKANLDGGNTFNGDQIFNNNITNNGNFYANRIYPGMSIEFTNAGTGLAWDGNGTQSYLRSDRTTKIYTDLILEAPAFKKIGGTSSQFLKADGSIDSNTYATVSSLPTIDQSIIQSSTNVVSGGAVYTGLSNIAVNAELFRNGSRTDYEIIQSAIDYGGVGANILLGKDKTYIIDNNINVLKNQKIIGQNSTIKRSNEQITTLSTSATSNSTTIVVASIPSGWKIGDRIQLFSDNSKGKSILFGVKITNISGNSISIDRAVGNSNDGTITNWIVGTKVRKIFYLVSGDNDFYTNNTPFVLENIIFDGNKTNNASNYYWYANGTIGISGFGSKIENCSFKNISNECIVGHGFRINNCNFTNLNGSAIHFSGDLSQGGFEKRNAWVTNCVTSNTNIISTLITGHSEGVITQSNQGGYHSISNNRFYNGGDSILGFFATTSDAYTDGASEIVFSNNICKGFSSIIYGFEGNMPTFPKWNKISNNIFLDCGTNNWGFYANFERLNIDFSNNQLLGNTAVNANRGFLNTTQQGTTISNKFSLNNARTNDPLIFENNNSGDNSNPFFDDLVKYGAGNAFAGLQGGNSFNTSLQTHLRFFVFDGANFVYPFLINSSGNTLFGKTVDSFDGIIQVNGNITALPATASNHVVVKSQLDAFVPNIGSLEFNATDKTVWNNGKGDQGGNTSFGEFALRSKTNNAFDTGFGWRALQNNTTGVNNSAFGSEAMSLNVTGDNNVAIGNKAFSYPTSGDGNTVVGFFSGSTNATNNNTKLTKSTLLGSNIKTSVDDSINEIVIGADALGAGSNTATIGNTNITKTVLRGNVETNGKFIVANAVNANEAVNKGQLDAVGGLKQFKAILNQAGSSAPTFQSLRNTTGVVITMTYVSTGVYQITAPSATWQNGFTFISICNGTIISNEVVRIKRLGTATIEVRTFANNVASNDILKECSLNIESY